MTELTGKEHAMVYTWQTRCLALIPRHHGSIGVPEPIQEPGVRLFTFCSFRRVISETIFNSVDSGGAVISNKRGKGILVCSIIPWWLGIPLARRWADFNQTYKVKPLWPPFFLSLSFIHTYNSYRSNPVSLSDSTHSDTPTRLSRSLPTPNQHQHQQRSLVLDTRHSILDNLPYLYPHQQIIRYRYSI